MNSFDIRKKFLDFFEQNNHTVVPSSSLIPAEDPTLLFTNAGMNQFKDLFLGKEKRSYVRATSSQKCVRAGGKHNDLDAVGFTERHLTFFEMLGNFSFGDYFKKEAIEFAWDLLTKQLHLPPEKLFVTVFTTDDEAYEIWNKVVGIPPERIFRLGEKDNFWAMGETGPCGPCSEIYYDRGPEKQGPFEHASPGSDSPRYIEIWNLVFMQYNRQTDGALQPLTQTGVDTGMGLERLCMVLQGKDNVYHTDLFTTLIKALEELTGISYAAGDDNLKAAFHVLGDHVRSSSLLIADGCSPANDGRGYVLRKIIRRAALFAQKLSDDQQLLAKLADHFITHMSIIFPELVTNKSLIINLLNSEIERFSVNLVQGQNILAKFVEEQTKAGSTIIPGEQMFKLYDTYGFPPELTQLMAQERGFSIDLQAFETEMKKQQELSGKKNKEAVQDIFVTENVSTKFVGYETLETTSRIIFSSIIDNEAWIITEESPFYVECGGQVNDRGWVTINGHTFDVVDLKKTGDLKQPAIAIKLALPTGPTPEINVGDSAHSKVNLQTRMETVRNHTATHMLQAALIEVLGKQVKQAGSLVCASYLRFDFTHHEAMTKDQIEAVENLVNQKIQDAIATNIFNTTLQDAKTQGVISFFGEKYNPENVRVVQIPGFSAELCGGTHAHNTGIIGAFKITSDTALSTGVRRLFAVTGPEALKLFQQSFSSTKKLSEEFKVKQDEVISAVAKLQENYSQALTQIKQLKKQLIKSQLPDWKLEMKNVGSVPFLYRALEDVQGDELKGIATELEKIAPGFYCLVTKLDDRFGFFAYVSKQHEDQIDLKKFAEFLKVTWNLKGGGSSKQIQGGGQQLPEQFAEKVEQWLSTLV